MKYKYPKKITIGNTKFKINYNYKEDGAEFQYPSHNKKAYIMFGMACHKKSPEQFLSLIIHELKEIIQIEQSTRLWRRGTDEYEFHYTHVEHADLCNRLSNALVKFIR